MTRDKHGKYDKARGLPDNRGQANNSGLYVWLCNEVSQRFEHGSSLVEACYEQKEKRYVWLLEQVKRQYGEEATKLIEEFNEKRLYLDAERRQRDRFRMQEGFRKQAQKYPQHEMSFLRCVESIQKQIDKAQARWKFSQEDENEFNISHEGD